MVDDMLMVCGVRVVRYEIWDRVDNLKLHL
jgi:hypothetical protein